MARLLFGALLALLLGAGRAAQAQGKAPASPGVVQGVVLDAASGQPLREASVSLLQARDSSYVTFSLTDGSGRYALRGVRPGHYLLLVNTLGYKTLQQPADVPAAPAAPVEVPPLRLVAESQQLGEVVVTHERAPVRISGDTVAFSARAFRTQPNAPVEQLLKKLPGLAVGRDGTIRSQGQAVNMLVDGKPFFGGDPKMASRNLPADIIDQVQVYDQQSDQAAFSGIESGERQRTVNLITRRDKRRGYFGTEQAGAGTDGRYQARLGLNRFNNGRQLSVLAQADNANNQGFTNDGNPAAAGGATVGDAGSLNSSSGGLALEAPGGLRNAGSAQNTPNSGATGVTESALGGLNYRAAWGRSLEAAGSYLATGATTRNDQSVHRQNFTGDGSAAVPLTDRLAASRVRTSSHRASLRLDYRLDSLTSLRLTPAFTYQTTRQLRTATQQTSLGGSLLNYSTSATDALAHSRTGGGNALLQRKFRRVGRTLSASASLSLAGQDGLALNQSATTYLAAGPGTTELLDQQLSQRTPRQSTTLSLAYTEPFSLRHQLEAHYSYTTAPSQASRLATDYDAGTGQYDLYNRLLSNEFSSRYSAQQAGLTWQTRRLRYTYSLGLDAQQATLTLDNQTAGFSLRRTYPSLLPAATFSYTGAGSRTLRLTYRTSLTAPSASQLQPVPDNSNPLSISLGNPELRPEYAHSLTGTYNHFDPARSRSVLALLSGSAVQHRLVAASTFDAAGVRTTQPVNAEGYYQLSGFLALSQRLPTHQLNLNASTSGNFARSPSFLNGQPNLARTWSLSQTLSANSAYNDHLELGLNATSTYQQATYSRAETQQAATFTHTLSGDVYWRLPGRLVFSSEAYFTTSTGLAASYNQHGLLWNAGLAYQLFAARQGELKLAAFDLLNQNRSVVRNATDTYLEDVRSRVLARYLLLSFSYQLRHFGK
ncbi:MAG: outer membrane beta-barrel protein [Janthinobacterium lividum]